MRAPRLPSPFRNVRHAPRNFTFRSAHVDNRALRWKERKGAIEAEALGASDGKPRKLSFRGGPASRSERELSVQSTMRARRRAMLRSAVILAVLLYAAWRGLLWVEQTDFAREYLLIPTS